jgi:hypothetical protein
MEKARNKLMDFRDMTEREDFQPYVIKTKGGRRYSIAHRPQAFIHEEYPDTVIVIVRGQGVTLLGLDAIESIQIEHETATSSR